MKRKIQLKEKDFWEWWLITPEVDTLLSKWELDTMDNSLKVEAVYPRDLEKLIAMAVSDNQGLVISGPDIEYTITNFNGIDHTIYPRHPERHAVHKSDSITRYTCINYAIADVSKMKFMTISTPAGVKESDEKLT